MLAPSEGQGRKVKGRADGDVGPYMGWSLLGEKSRRRAAQEQGQRPLAP